MYSFDETHYLSLKQGEKTHETKNNIGITLSCVRQRRQGEDREPSPVFAILMIVLVTW